MSSNRLRQLHKKSVQLAWHPPAAGYRLSSFSLLLCSPQPWCDRHPGPGARFFFSHSLTRTCLSLSTAPVLHCCSLACFYYSTATLVNSFVSTRLHYCCSLYADLPAARLSCL